MQHYNLEKQGNELAVQFMYSHYTFPRTYEIHSDTFILGGLVSIKLKIYVAVIKDDYFEDKFFIQFEKCQDGDALNYMIEVTFPEMDINCQSFVTDNASSWRFLCEEGLSTESSMTKMVEMKIVLSLAPSPSPKFASLYDDTEMVDFQLKGHDRAVFVHKVLLAAHSPIMKTMFTGEWKENSTGLLDVPESSDQLLQNFKSYLYLDSLPDEVAELEPLLLLACCYKIPELIEKCSAKILFKMKSEETFHFMQLAHKYKIKKLHFGVIESAKDSYNGITNCFCANKDCM